MSQTLSSIKPQGSAKTCRYSSYSRSDQHKYSSQLKNSICSRNRKCINVASRVSVVHFVPCFFAKAPKNKYARRPNNWLKMETIRGLKFVVVMSFLLIQFSVYGKLTSFSTLLFPFVCVGIISQYNNCKTHGLEFFSESKHLYFYCKAPSLNILKVKKLYVKKLNSVYIYLLVPM